jgi:hypothetical protein
MNPGAVQSPPGYRKSRDPNYVHFSPLSKFILPAKDVHFPTRDPAPVGVSGETVSNGLQRSLTSDRWICEIDWREGLPKERGQFHWMFAVMEFFPEIAVICRETRPGAIERGVGWH